MFQKQMRCLCVDAIAHLRVVTGVMAKGLCFDRVKALL